jgi:hypothetical protein
MTTAEALAVAAQAKPKHGRPLDKLQGITAAHFGALQKSFDVMGHAAMDMQKQLDRAQAGVALFMDVMKIKPANLETLQ